MVKRGLIIFSLFAISIFLLSFASAEVAGCRITTRSQCVGTEVPVLGLSATTNAHGELGNQNNYNYVLCCEAVGKVGSTQCSGTNTILILSGTTNAHAEINTIKSYPPSGNVCFDEISCTTTPASACPSDFPIPTVSLSTTTNAHIAQPFGTGSYATKICCKKKDIDSCGNGIIESGEACDDGCNANYDGCSISCQEEPGYTCEGMGTGSCCWDDTPIMNWNSASGIFTSGTIGVGTQLTANIFEDYCITSDGDFKIQIYKKRVRRDILITTISGSKVSPTCNQKKISGTWVVSQADLNIIGNGNSNLFIRVVNPRNGDAISGGDITVTVAGPECGDGIKNGDEQCDWEDGGDLGGATCASVLGTDWDGDLHCYKNCTYDVVNCELGSTETCASLGYECGTVNGETCLPGCNTQTETCQAGQCIPITAECSIPSASWAVEEIIEGNSAQLNVQTSNCIGQMISFTVVEKDGLGNPDDAVSHNPNSKQVTSNTVTQTWTAEYIDDSDGGQTGDPEYEFTATIGSKSRASSNLLTVLEQSSEECLGVDFCLDYKTETACEADACGVGGRGISSYVDCGYGIDCICSWVDGACEDGTVEWCNDNNIINIGEQCDGTNWGPVPTGTDLGCQYFGYTGGTLTCNNCVFDTSQCTGKTTGDCGNGVINTGEQCDTGMSLTNCTSLDAFTGGSLTCNNDYCLLNTANCEGGEGPYIPPTGGCVYSDSMEDDCEDGSLTRNLTATWVGEGTGECESPGLTTIVCPAQIKVKAFGIVQFAIAVILLIIIYIIIRSRINTMRRKKVPEKYVKKKISKKKRR
jgi:cysteine-rich repeat protein